MGHPHYAHWHSPCLLIYLLLVVKVLLLLLSLDGCYSAAQKWIHAKSSAVCSASFAQI
jgi:hypothetical protein